MAWLFREEGLIEIGEGCGPGDFFPVAIGPMSCDGVEPGAKTRHIFQMRQRLEGQQQGVLDHVLRRLGRADDFSCNREHCRPVADRQFVECP